MPADQLRILLDTNVVIAAESDEHPRHPRAGQAAELLSLSARLGHVVCVASTIRDDFARHAEAAHRVRRDWQLQRYHVLDPIAVPSGFRERAGYPPSVGPSGQVDMTLLLALERRAAQWLVTDDQGIHDHARTLGLSDRTFTLADAIDVLARQLAQPIAVPAVREVKGFQLDTDDPIFDDFDPSYDVRRWVQTKVAPEHRPCLVIGEPGHLDSLVVLNEERYQAWGLPGKVLKVCTFKVAPQARGIKRGELLLWAVFQYARANAYDSIFIEVFDRELVLIAMLEAFGFHKIAVTTARPGELVYGKLLRAEGRRALSPLRHHITYGPGALAAERIFLVPIIPQWHASLLPAAEEQLELMPGLTDQGNAIRKAYLSKTNSRLLAPGDVLLFLRTHEARQVRAVGVVEETAVSSDPVEVLEFTGRRTVYTPREVSEMCSERPVLAIRFRLDRVLDTPLSAADLIEHGAMRRSPQSIAQITNPGAIGWLQDLLGD